MHAWSKFTLYLWFFFLLKVHETCLPMLSYRNLITKSICQWFLSDMVFNFQTYMVIKYSSFNLFNYENFLIFMFQFIWLSIYGCQRQAFLVISLFRVLVDWFWNFKLFTYLIFQIFGFQVCAYLIFLILWMSSFKLTPICQMTYGHIHS
jgi:hypothetical protein